MITVHRRPRRTVRRLLLRHLGGTIHHTLTAARSFIGFGSYELLPVKYFDKQNAYGEGFPAVASGSGGNVLDFCNICAKAVSDHG
jgi:hypothetical protein